MYYVLCCRMAPEVILCETLKDDPYDYKADVWSLGTLSHIHRLISDHMLIIKDSRSGYCDVTVMCIEPMCMCMVVRED